MNHHSHRILAALVALLMLTLAGQGFNLSYLQEAQAPPQVKVGTFTWEGWSLVSHG